MDLGLRHLRAVVAVADAGSYTAAARELLVAQSSLSRTVQEVEHKLGVQLFERTTRMVRPTIDGEQFLTIARRLLAEADTAFRHFEGYLAGTRGAISVAALPSLAATLLPPVIAAFRRARPEVSISVRDGLSQQVLDLVAGGVVDLALTVAADTPAPLAIRRVALDRFSCVLPTGHPLAAQGEIEWEQLAGEPFVSFSPNSSIRQYVDRELLRRRIVLGPLTEAANIGAVAGLTAAGLGVSIIPGLVAPMMSFASLVHRPLGGPVVQRDLCLVHDPRRPLSRAAHALMHLIATAETRGIELPPDVSWVEASASHAMATGQ